MARKEKKKMGKFEIGFTIFSLIFLIGFSCFYGYRFFYYKNQFAPKGSDGKVVTLLVNKIKEKVVTTGDGLYNEENNFIFKGENVNNYVRYSNMLFRIIKINKDNTIEMVLDDSLNYLSYDSEKINYKESDLNKYLNDVFYNNIKGDSLIKTPYCNGKVSDVNNITCGDIEIDYVKLLSLSDYLNSKIDEKSYLNKDEIVWLSNSNDDSVWLLNNGSLSMGKPNDLYLVKPVIAFDNLSVYVSGDGSKDNPYVIENDKSYFASYVKLGEDIYRVSDVKENVLKLQSEELYKEGNIKYQLSNSNSFNLEEGLGKYLNTELIEELEYKDLLVECDMYTGNYDNAYSNVTKSSVKGKVGVQSIIEPIFNKEKSNYYFSTPFDNETTYIYNEVVYNAKSSIIRNISLSVCINKDKLVNGNGSIDNPYVVSEEVQE